VADGRPAWSSFPYLAELRAELAAAGLDPELVIDQISRG
jgi:hypothetical protein